MLVIVVSITLKGCYAWLPLQSNLNIAVTEQGLITASYAWSQYNEI